MKNHNERLHEIAVFKKKKVMTLDQIATLLDCSIRSTQRQLRLWCALRSYNQNGRFFTLPAIATFDDYGLWQYKGIYFSRYGSLKQTVLGVVCASPMGLDASEIGGILGLVPRSFMAHCRDLPGMTRERSDGRYLYFSDDTEMQREQRHNRQQQQARNASQLPADADAVLILVDRIKYPDASLDECARRLAKIRPHIQLATIQALLAHHGIKKKTPGIPS